MNITHIAQVLLPYILRKLSKKHLKAHPDRPKVPETIGRLAFKMVA